MRRDEIFHRVRVLAPRCGQQLVEARRCRDREDRGIDHGASPFLAVRRRDAYPQAPYPDRRIRRVRIGGAEIEAPEHRIPSAGEDLGPRQLGPGSVSFEHAGEAGTLGMIAAVAECRPGGRCQRRHQSRRRQTLGRKPSCRISKGSGADANDDGDQRQRSSGDRWGSSIQTSLLQSTGLLGRRRRTTMALLSVAFGVGHR